MKLLFLLLIILLAGCSSEPTKEPKSEEKSIVKLDYSSNFTPKTLIGKSLREAAKICVSNNLDWQLNKILYLEEEITDSDWTNMPLADVQNRSRWVVDIGIDSNGIVIQASMHLKRS